MNLLFLEIILQILLGDLNEAGILHNLFIRYNNHQIYVSKTEQFHACTCTTVKVVQEGFQFSLPLYSVLKGLSLLLCSLYEIYC